MQCSSYPFLTVASSPLSLQRRCVGVCVCVCMWNASWGVWHVLPVQIAPEGFLLGSNHLEYIHIHCTSLMSEAYMASLTNEVQFEEVWKWSCIVSPPKGGSQHTTSDIALRTCRLIFATCRVELNAQIVKLKSRRRVELRFYSTEAFWLEIQRRRRRGVIWVRKYTLALKKQRWTGSE